MIQDIKARILAGGEITEEEALALLTTPHKEELYQAAHEIT
ncbi:MAG: biotin synthase BioB, partial [Porphyromonadaceae bacterium]|nr:biotin synthase BioB [Porphyromonadaceae bacterium]